MTEWLKVPVLKTGVGTPYRGFESHSLRHFVLTRTLGSNSAAEGLFVLVAGQGDDGGNWGAALLLLKLPLLRGCACPASLRLACSATAH